VFTFAAAVSALSAQESSAPIELRIGVVTPPRPMSDGEISSLRGVRLGAAEAKQTGRLFGGDVDLYEAAGDGRARGTIRAAKFLASRRKVQILIGISTGDADSLSRFAENHGLIFLNIASRSNALRAACRPHSFHVEASDAMYASALEMSRRDQSRAGPPLGGHRARIGDVVVLWNENLERFGASQVNNRFRAANRIGMDGRAWAGWAAVKIGSEAALRARSTAVERILAYLEQPTSRFDGHKGWQLGFRPADHQLRQPLYIVVRPARTSAGQDAPPNLLDVPDLRAVRSGRGAESPDAVLDGLSAGAPHCSWSRR
jgi:ABC-type branched-subunit amino acid transport system substrate-binding protein